MAQQHEETQGVASPSTESAGDVGVARDPWASLSVVDEDLTAVPPVFAATAVFEGDAAEAVVDDGLADPDPESGEAAEANAAAVEAAAAAAHAEAAAAPTRGGAFTIPLLCAGVAIIAACLLIPQADANRRLAYERLKLQADLQAVERQVETNDEFLRKVSEDPNLAERLAQRQMKIIRVGNEVLNLKSDGEEEMSPFQLTAVAAPADLAPYAPRGGALADLCYNPKSRLYLMGIGLLAMAAGLVLGFGPPRPE